MKFFSLSSVGLGYAHFPRKKDLRNTVETIDEFVNGIYYLVD